MLYLSRYIIFVQELLLIMYVYWIEHPYLFSADSFIFGKKAAERICDAL